MVALSKPHLDTSTIYRLFELIKRFNSFVGLYSKDLETTGEEMERLSRMSQNLVEKVTAPASTAASFSRIDIMSTSGKNEALNQYLGVAFELFRTLYSSFCTAGKIDGNTPQKLIVPSDQIIPAMKLVLRTMITYIFLLSGLHQSLIATCERWQHLYSVDVNEILGDQFDAPIMVDRALNLNFVGRPKNISNSESAATALQLYETILSMANKSLRNPDFIRTMDTMHRFGEQLNNQITRRKPVQIRRAPPIIDYPNNNTDVPQDPSVRALDMFFATSDVLHSNPANSKSGQLLRHLLSTATETSRCFEKGTSGSGFIDLDESADMRAYRRDNDDDDKEDGDGEKRRKLNNALLELEREFVAVSTQSLETDNESIDTSGATQNLSKYQRIQCLNGILAKYLDTMFKAGEAIFADAAITLSPDEFNLAAQESPYAEDFTFLNDLQSNLQDAAAYIVRQMGLVKTLMDKFISLKQNISREFEKFQRIKSQNAMLKMLLDSQIKFALTSVFSTGVVMYTTVPYTLVPILLEQLYQSQTSLFDKFSALRSEFTSTDPSNQYLVQINGLVLQTMEELVLRLPIANDTNASNPFDNKSLCDSYGKFFSECIEKMFEYAGAYLYLANRKKVSVGDNASKTKWSPQVVVKAPSGDIQRSAYELAPINNELAKSKDKYIECITVSVAASRQRKNVPFLLLSYLQQIESAIVLDAIYNFWNSNNNSANTIMLALNELIEVPAYVEDKINKTVQLDPLDIPPVVVTLYTRLLLAAIALAPRAELTVSGKQGTLKVKDDELRQHYQKLWAKTTFIAARSAARKDIIFSDKGFKMDMTNPVAPGAQTLTVRPEFFTDVLKLAEFPRISDYLVPAGRADKAQKTNGPSLFPREHFKAHTDEAKTVKGRMALLHTMGTCVGHLVVAINQLVPSAGGIYTLHPFTHDIDTLDVLFE